MSHKFDARVIYHNLRRGELNQDELDAHLNALPDDAEHAEATTTEYVAMWASRSDRAAENAETPKE